MQDPLTGATALGKFFGSSLAGATFYGFITQTDFGVVFGAFAGAVFYVATASNVSRWRLVGFFITSFIVGVIGADPLGSWIVTVTEIKKPVDALCAVIISTLCIKFLTFINDQGFKALAGALLSFLSRFGSGGPKQ
ncbi:putative holin [Trabulsiella odontotermitis]|uniref:putative holin n=1 Tax=Trabulsiella odontotermitis TaxID=379893 RepID=UPI003ACE717E